MSEYMKKTDKYGKIWIWTAVVVVVMVPLAACIYYGVWPEMNGLFKGMLGVAPIFWTVGFIEVVTYTPMLGTAGTYLSFVTGNLTTLKVPCALNAMENAKVTADTEEGEVISTISIATSSIVTTLIIVLGVIVLSFIRPILEADILQPAFDNILPALFGGLAVVYVSKNWKISIIPLIVMTALFIAVPSLASSVGVLVPVGVLITLGSARIMYKKGWL